MNNNLVIQTDPGKKILFAILPADAQSTITDLVTYLKDLGGDVRWLTPQNIYDDKNPKATLIKMIKKNSGDKIYWSIRTLVKEGNH